MSLVVCLFVLVLLNVCVVKRERVCLSLSGPKAWISNISLPQWVQKLSESTGEADPEISYTGMYIRSIISQPLCSRHIPQDYLLLVIRGFQAGTYISNWPECWRNRKLCLIFGPLIKKTQWEKYLAEVLSEKQGLFVSNDLFKKKKKREPKRD